LLSGAEAQTDRVVFNISALPAGIYFLKIQTEKGMINKKVVKYQ
jgi:hypothetical protein